MKIINREASDKAKGFRLQKLRAAQKLVEHVDEESFLYFCTIEYKEDVYEKEATEDGYKEVLEEDKLYNDSQVFTANSDAVQKTLVSFLDQWCDYKYDKNIGFSFYTNLKIGKEKNSGIYKSLSLKLPSKPILQLLSTGEIEDEDLQNFAKVLLERYRNDYISKTESYIDYINRFTVGHWRDFFSQVDWNFGERNMAELEDDIKQKIRLCSVYNGNDQRHIDHIFSSIVELVDKSQHEISISKRLIPIGEVRYIISSLGGNNKPFDDAHDEWRELEKSELVNDKRNAKEKILDVCPKFNIRKLSTYTRKIVSVKKEYSKIGNEKDLCTFKYRIFEACDEIIYDIIKKLNVVDFITDETLELYLEELYKRSVERIADREKDYRFCRANEDIIRKTVLVLFDECYLAFDEK